MVVPLSCRTKCAWGEQLSATCLFFAAGCKPAPHFVRWLFALPGVQAAKHRSHPNRFPQLIHAGLDSLLDSRSRRARHQDIGSRLHSGRGGMRLDAAVHFQTPWSA